jgi:spermidine synthase
MIIELAKTNPSLLAQNNRSFLDSRVHVHIKDAKKYLAGELQQYNVIIIDFPDPVNSILSSLYTKELFSKVANLLSEDGALVCQSNSPEDAPQVFWSIGKTIKRTGLYTKGYNVIVPSFGLWGFHLATHEKISRKIPNISVPHQALPTNMETMFEIPSSIKEEQENAFVNTETQLKLHDLYQKEIKDLY